MFIINRVLFLINVILALALLIAYLSPYVNPSVFWPVAFMGLAYPLLFIINSLFVLYWLVQGKMKMLVSALCLFAGFNYFPRVVKFSGQETSDTVNTVKVSTFNAKGFAMNTEKPFLDSVRAYLEREKPDIICFQEFWNRKDKKTGRQEVLRAMLQTLKMPHYKFHGINGKKDGHGIILFSKYPIVGSSDFNFGSGSLNGALRADVKIGKDTIRIYGVHFQSNRLNPSEALTKKDIEEQEIAMKKSKNILKRLKYGFEKRAGQAEEIRDDMDKSPYPILLIGDFNDTQLSYTYNILNDGMKDAFEESGKGFGYTYVGPFPSYRIDYIMLDEDFEAFNYSSGPLFGSDHKIIQSLVKIR